MKYIKAKHYLVDTDMELLQELSTQLKGSGLGNFDALLAQLERLQINSFAQLLQYLSGPDCEEELALVGESLLERLRNTVADREVVLTSSNEVGLYLTNKLATNRQEEFWAIYIDNSNHIIAEKCLFKGTVDQSIAHPREIFRWGILYGGVGIFVVHNHPSGELLPSKSDLALTRRLQACSELMQIDFLDHFIVGKGHYLSMREQQLF